MTKHNLSTDNHLALSPTDPKRLKTLDDSAGSFFSSQPTSHALSLVQTPTLSYPRSAYKGWQPSQPTATEFEAWALLGHPEYVQLESFSIYHPHDHQRHAQAMVSVHFITEERFSRFLLQGLLSTDNPDQRSVRPTYVVDVPFEILSIDGYGSGEKIGVFIQSLLGRRMGFWYQLHTPSLEYSRFYRPFLWLAQFTKYFVDYLLFAADQGFRVSLAHFRHNFRTWLVANHEHSTVFRQWDAQAYFEDYGTTIAAHVRFLWKEYTSVDIDNKNLAYHTIWKEVDPRDLPAIPKQINVEIGTIVTPFTWHCFQHMYFGKKLEVRPIQDASLRRRVSRRKALLKLTPLCESHGPKGSNASPRMAVSEPTGSVLQVRQGDVVALQPETNGNSNWKCKEKEWFAYVQAVRQEPRSSVTRLDILWLYHPSHTTIDIAYYPFSNELFLSDNCECGLDAWRIDKVIRIVQVDWFHSDPNTSQSEYFIRRKFRTAIEEESFDFVDLKPDDFACQCKSKADDFERCASQYTRGDNVLYRCEDDQILEPGQLVYVDPASRRVLLRRFKRKHSHEEQINMRHHREVIVTNDAIWISPSDIIRKCPIFLLPPTGSKIDQGLYTGDSSGDAFFISSHISIDDNSSGSAVYPDSARSATVSVPTIVEFPPLNFAKPQEASRMLQGMGIFCGGGNFDRGLEEGGAVKFRYAVDWEPFALHSYRANCQDPEDIRFFNGSVNDYLARAIAGAEFSTIASPNDVDILVAGTPCPGFSNLQLHKLSDQSLRNASMVASAVSFVDFYSPAYFVLENLISMAQGHGPKKTENVFCQILAALVALGYQVQQFLLDSWSYGSCEQRSRLFLVASAPGIPPLPFPAHTHAHPSGVSFLNRCIGRVNSNSLRFGTRRDHYTPFSHLSPATATADLPDIGDSQPQICIQFPDHRTPLQALPHDRLRISMVPTYPRSMGIMQAYKQGLLRGEPAEWAKEREHEFRGRKATKMLSRISPDSLFPTFTTGLRIHDGIVGNTLHWDQHRMLTVMEARRALGFEDHEVLVGSPVQQLRIIGNSVNRASARALGRALFDSWTAVSSEGMGLYAWHSKEPDEECSEDSPEVPETPDLAYTMSSVSLNQQLMKSDKDCAPNHGGIPQDTSDVDEMNNDIPHDSGDTDDEEELDFFANTSDLESDLNSGHGTDTNLALLPSDDEDGHGSRQILRSILQRIEEGERGRSGFDR